MRNLTKVDPKNLPVLNSIKAGKTQGRMVSREAIDELKLLSRINGLLSVNVQEGQCQNDQADVLQVLFDVDEILAGKKRGEAVQRVEEAIADKIFGESFSFGGKCAVRIATLRIVSRLCAGNEKWVVKMLQQNIDLIVLRALHVREVSEIERCEALYLITPMFSALSARSVSVLVGWWRFQLFAKNVLHFLINVSVGGFPSAEDLPSKNTPTPEDKMPNTNRKFFVIASGILLELLARFPSMFLALNVGLGWLTRLMHKCFETDNAHLARIGAQLLANLVDCPEVRRRGELQLLIQQIFAPLLDVSIFSASLGANQPFENTLLRKLQLCANCLADLLNTWPGFFVCFAVDNYKHSPCQSIIMFLKSTSYWIKQHEKLMGVEVFSRMLCLPYANKELSTWDEAMQFFERVQMPDPYKASLSEDFVLAELPFLRSTLQTESTDLFKAFQSIRVYALCHSGLPEALIRTIIQSPDSPCAVKGTLLLADILHIATVYLPREWRLKAHGVAELVNRAAQAFQPAQFGEHTGDEHLKNADLDWTNSNENCSNAITLYARLEQIERLRARPVEEKLCEMDTFFLANLGHDGQQQQKRRRSSEHSVPSRHSSKASSSGPTAEEHKGAVAKDEIEGFLAVLDDLLPKAFVVTPSNLGQQTSHAPKMHKSSSATNITGVGVGIPIMAPIQIQHQNSAEGHNKQPTAPQWPVVWHILHTVGNNLGGKSVDKCVPMLDQLVHHFLPSNRQFLRRDIDALSVACGQQCFRLLCICAHSSASVGLDNSHWAAQQVASFLLNFCAQLQIMGETESIFCSRSPLHSGVRYYFAILRIISSHSAGQKLLEQTAVNQLLYELVLKPSTCNSLIKLILVSLDYFPSVETDGQGIFARGLLEAVLLHSTLNESIKKWAVRLLNVFITLEQLGHLPTFVCWHWTLNLAFRQLSNPSLKIVRRAAKLLLNWLPKCPMEARKTAIVLLKNSKLTLLGNLGMLLEKALRAWKDHFNLCYVDIVEERMRKTLFLNNGETFQHKRSMDGHFARASFNDENGKCQPCIFTPEHLYGQLIRTKTGQTLLQAECAVDDVVKTLQNFLLSTNVDQKRVKASLLALAHLLANVDPYRTQLFVGKASSAAFCGSIASLVQLLRDCVEQQQSLCVRGFALWAVNIAANGNGRVAGLLTASGWECGQFVGKICCLGDSFASVKKEFGLAPIVSNLICIQRLSKIAGKGNSTENEHDYRFISEKENSALIAYRKFLVTAGEINEYDVSKRNIGLYTPTEDGQQKGIFLPTFAESNRFKFKNEAQH
uniref:RICTOR_N domain-containing protein n=1 Tax=Globodera pallida TaxID=36090 RepID=A0A183CH43_GLOPA